MITNWRGRARIFSDGALRQPPRHENTKGGKGAAIEDWLNKTQRVEHSDYEPDLNFKKAKTEANAQQPGLAI
jgi:hypothetical protein